MRIATTGSSFRGFRILALSLGLGFVLPCASNPLLAPGESHVPIEQLPPRVAEKLIVSLSATDALWAMENGKLTSEVYVETLIRRASRHEQLNAFVTLDRQQALAAARRADATRASGAPLGPLHGLPVVVKDSINTSDLPTTAGTPALSGFQPPANAPAMQRLLDAGAIVLGKTNLHEMSAGFTTTNFFTGATLNPYDFTRVPGGSSGGNGAALAARFAPAALGEDTGGSARVPAVLNGVTGFRPTTGRYPQGGVVPLSPTLDTIGPMARTVADLALLDSVISGDVQDLPSVRLEGLRIGVPQAHFQELLDAEVKSALDGVLQRLEGAGVVLIEADIPLAGELSQQASLVLNLFEAPPAISDYLAENDAGIDLIELVAQIASPDVAFLFSLAGTVSEPDYLGVRFELVPLLRSLYLEYLAGNDLDAVLMPTNAVPAPPIGATEVTVNGIALPVFDAFFRLGHYTPVVAAPTVSLPIGQSPNGLPVGGIDIAAAPGDDRRVLAIAAAVEQVLPRVRPPKAVRPLPIGESNKGRGIGAPARRPH